MIQWSMTVTKDWEALGCQWSGRWSLSGLMAAACGPSVNDKPKQSKLNVPFTSTGFLASEALKETDEDSGSEVNLNSSIMTEEEREEILQELAKVCVAASRNERGVVVAGRDVSAFVSVCSWKRRSGH